MKEVGAPGPHGGWWVEELPAVPGELAIRFDAHGKRYLARCVCDGASPCCHGFFKPGDRFCYACRGWVGPGPGWRPQRWFTIHLGAPDLVTPPRPERDRQRQTSRVNNDGRKDGAG